MHHIHTAAQATGPVALHSTDVILAALSDKQARARQKQAPIIAGGWKDALPGDSLHWQIST